MFVLLHAKVMAETIQLKSGKTLEGKIVERTDSYIKLDTGLGFPLTYFLDEVSSISGEGTIGSTEGLSSKEVPQVISKAQDAIYANQEFSVSIAPPKGWYVQVIEKTVYEQLDEQAQQIFDEMNGSNNEESQRVKRLFLQQLGLKEGFTKQDLLMKMIDNTYNGVILSDEQRKSIISEIQHDTDLVKFLNYQPASSYEDMIRFLQEMPLEKRCGIALNVVDTSHRPQMRNVWDFVDESITQAQNWGQYTMLERPHEVDVNGKQMVRYAISLQMQTPQGKTTTTHSLFVFFLDGRRLYRLTYFGLSAQSFNDNLLLFEQTLNSLKIR
jgi:hypothetical protein